jgi:glucosyl-3-phosphoglycerate synthase
VQVATVVEEVSGHAGVGAIERVEDGTQVGAIDPDRGLAVRQSPQRAREVDGGHAQAPGSTGVRPATVGVVPHPRLVRSPSWSRRLAPRWCTRAALWSTAVLDRRPVSHTVPDRTIDRFTARTWSHHDFDAADLAARKREAGLTVSVVIPARDEEATVGTVAGTFVDELGHAHGLVDEVVVVDAHSSDRTAEVARAAGARVVDQAEVLAHLGSAPGKGEALWKGLAATAGDLVCFVDADIVDVGPRFVVGLLGPLLVDPEVAYVKATYDRPLDLGSELRPTGGGRVTELLARPLLDAFWPELAWLAQPLSGEYAGRRDLLESLPFVRGYGVELGLLVDTVAAHGADVIAQVDLGRRVHVHQPLDALGRMAAEILHVAVDRLARQGRLVLTDPLAPHLLQPVRDVAGDLHLERHEVAPSERPPLREVRGGQAPAG